MKLINADLFLKEIINLCGCVPYIEGKNGNAIYLNNLLNEQLNAYDIDKVIDRIRNIPHGQVLNVELENEIIEIIKSGFM